jgi:hypothetical protein
VTARGIAIEYEASAVVMHAPELSLARFWRQQVRYGRGAYRFHRTQPAGARLMPLRFYGALLHAGFALGPSVGALVMLAQLATASGIARERWADRATRRSRQPEPPGSSGREQQRLPDQIGGRVAREGEGGRGDVLEARRARQRRRL